MIGVIWVRMGRPRILSDQQRLEHRRDKNRRYREANRDKIRDLNRKRARKGYEENPERSKECTKRYRAANPEKLFETQLRKYGITPGQYRDRLAAQEGKCAICKTETPGGHGRFHVDHDHATGEFRGILCHRCNVGLGYMKDDPVILQGAISYLAKGSNGE